MASKLPGDVGFTGALTVAGGLNKLEGVDFSFDVGKRYTFWSGLLGGLFLALRTLARTSRKCSVISSGGSLRESRLGLMFNAVCKIPMQFFILLLGVMLFVFYQFEPPPIFFNQTAWNNAVATESGGQLQSLARQYESECASPRPQSPAGCALGHSNNPAEADALREPTCKRPTGRAKRPEPKPNCPVSCHPCASSNDADYVFVTFILNHLPHGLIGLLITVFLAATLSSKAAELNARGSTTTVDLYRHIMTRGATECTTCRLRDFSRPCGG